MPSSIDRWTARCKVVEEAIAPKEYRASSEDLRAIAVVAALLLVVDELAYMTEHWEMAGSGI